MKIVVLKFGGTSVGSIDRIKKAASIIVRYTKKKYKVIVVSSAMSGVTNDLVRKSNQISNNFIDLVNFRIFMWAFCNYWNLPRHPRS